MTARRNLSPNPSPGLPANGARSLAHHGERPPEDMAALHASVSLRRGRFALDITLDAPAGVTALLGPSGAGKSLTLQAIAGLTPISVGRVTLNGRTLEDTAAGVNLPPRLRRVGYVPQNYALFPHLSVAGNIAYGLDRGLDRAAREKRVAELLALGRLAGYEARRPRDLSGGEAQRVAVLRALAAEPEALLLDEPFSALDAPTRAAVRDDLGALIAVSGLPAVLVTHDLSEALALAGRLALLVEGRVAVAGPAAEALATPPTLGAARLLGWTAALAVAGYVMEGGATRLTLPGGQTLTLDGSSVAPGILERPVARVALAVRPERLLIGRAGPGDADGADGGAGPCALRGTLASGADGAPERVTLDGGAEPLRLALAPREWVGLGLTAGDVVTLRPLPGALRLVVEETS
ncbi:MAG TPA: ABC transporter ATP-binding protein [Ktedonobacterales bacterium]